MTLEEALTEAARVAMQEREKYCNDDGCVSEDLFPGTDTRAFEIVYRGSPSACEQFIAARVNAAVFAWWHKNWRDIEELIVCDQGEAFELIAVASGEAS